MDIRFEEEYLKELYEDGKAKSKKHRFQKVIIRKYKNTIDKLKAAEKIEDLFALKSLNYKKLKGDKKGIESIRVDQKYRIEFTSSVEGDEPNGITICSIIELSNHYK